MNTLRECFGKSETFTESQKWVVSQLTPIFPYHVLSGIEAVVAMQTVGIVPFDSRVLLQQCIDFILDNGSILEAAVTEYTVSVSMLNGTSWNKRKQNLEYRNQISIVDSDDEGNTNSIKLPGTSRRKFGHKRKHHTLDYRNEVAIVDSDDDDDVRMVEALTSMEANLNKNQIQNCSSKLNDGFNVNVKNSRTGDHSFVHNEFATAFGVTKHNPVTSDMAQGMLIQSGSSGSNKSSVNSNSHSSTTHSVIQTTTVIPNAVNVDSDSSFHTPALISNHTEFIPSDNQYFLNESKFVESGGSTVRGSSSNFTPSGHIYGSTLLGLSNAILKSGTVGGTIQSELTGHSSTMGYVTGDSVVKSQTFFSSPGQVNGTSLLASNHFQKHGKVNGVCSASETSSESLTLGQVNGVSEKPSFSQSSALGQVNGISVSQSFSQSLTQENMHGVGITHLSSAKSILGHVGELGFAGSSNQNIEQRNVGGVSVVGSSNQNIEQRNVSGSSNQNTEQRNVGGVNVTGSSNQNTELKNVGGVSMAGSSNQNTELRHVGGVSVAGSSNQNIEQRNVGGVSVVGSSNQNTELIHVGETLTTPILKTILNTSTSALTDSSSSGIITANSDVSVNKMPDPPKSELEEKTEQVIQLFPDVDPAYVMDQLRLQVGLYSVNNVCTMILENPDFPKRQPAEVCTISQNQKPVEDKTDYFKDYAQQICTYSESECSRLLQNQFRKVSVRDISRVLQQFNGHYAPTYKVLFNAMEQSYKISSENSSTKSVQNSSKMLKIVVQGKSIVVLNLLKGMRPAKPVLSVDPELQKEIDFVINKMKAEKQEADEKFAWQLNENEYEDSGQLIECNCCFGEHPFESMVQCYDGHLFCRQCLLNYAKEAVYGSGKLGLACMAPDCDSSFPISEMKRSLPESILLQYEERIRESNLNLADLKDLVRCPHCDYAAIMAPGDKVFKCQSQSCLKETCRYCQEEWSSHIGIPCNELEKKDESHLRKQYEEKMTEAKIRTCHRCKNKFTKDEGCNKMTCTCNATMCYICRKSNISYNHFCGHPREPGHKCTKCTACSLWTNPDEDDDRAIKEIQDEANEKRKEKGFEENKLIGAPSEPPTKKKKL